MNKKKHSRREYHEGMNGDGKWCDVVLTTSSSSCWREMWKAEVVDEEMRMDYAGPRVPCQRV